MKDFKDFLEALFSGAKSGEIIIGGMGEPDYKSWVQVGTLTSEESIRRKENNRRLGEIEREMKLLKAKAARLHAESEEIHVDSWNTIRKAHSLPHEGEYHLTEDLKILMKPKDK